MEVRINNKQKMTGVICLSVTMDLSLNDSLEASMQIAQCFLEDLIFFVTSQRT